MLMPCCPVPVGFYIDSADQAAAERWLPTGIFRGITTNPTILRDAGRHLSECADIYSFARQHAAEEVFFQTWGGNADELYANAQRLLEMAPECIIKVPTTEAGSQATARLRRDGVPVLMTAVYSTRQALVGAALDVEYIAPYFNRMFMAGRNAMGEIGQMCRAIPQDGTGPLLVAASIKSAQHVVALTDLGVRRFTISPEVIGQLFDDDLAHKAVDVFEEDMTDVL